jgi:hypothetical protein
MNRPQHIASSAQDASAALFTALEKIQVKWNDELWRVGVIAVYAHDGRFSVHYELNGSRQVTGLVSVWQCEPGQVLMAIDGHLRRAHRRLAQA